MSKVGLNNSIPAQALPLPAPGRPAAAQASPVANAASLAPRDKLQATAGPAPTALTSVPIVESAEFKQLKPLLEQSGPLLARCETLAAEGIGAQQREALDNLQLLLTQADSVQDTLGTLSEDPGLDPNLRAYLSQLMQQMTTVLASAQSGDQAAFQQALSAPLKAGGHNLPLAYGLQHLQHMLEFDQVLQRRSGRELLVQNMNQAFAQGVKLLDAGTSLAQVDERVMADMQKAMGEQNKSLLDSLVKGDVQKSIFGLQRRYATNLKVPGFAEAVQKALTEAGQPPQNYARLASAEVIGRMPIDDLEKIQTALQHQRDALPQDAGHAALRAALTTTLEQDFNQSIGLRAGFQQFRVTMQEHVSELTADLLRFAGSSGFELPQEIKRALEDDPLAGSEQLQAWIQTCRSTAAGSEDLIHVLDGLEQFALQLGTGAGILNRVARGEQIDTGLMDNFEKFQTFILAKRALIDYFDNKNGPQMREAIIEFGNKYADWQKLSAADRQHELTKWLGGYLDHGTLVKLEQQIYNLRAGAEAHNLRVVVADGEGVPLVNPEHRPPRANLDRQIAGFDARFTGLLRRESGFYRHVFETRGDAGLRRQLAQDRAQVLDPLAKSMDQLEKAMAAAPAGKLTPVAGSEPAPAAAPERPPLPTAQGISQSLRQAEINQRLDAQVAALKGELVKALRVTRQQVDAQNAAMRLREQLQHQIFELYNQRQLESNRHQLAALEEIDAFVQHQLDRAQAAATETN